MLAPPAEGSFSRVAQSWASLGMILERYSFCGQNFEQCTWFISLEEEKVRHATITNMWTPANNVAGWCGFGNSIAGKSGLSWSGRGIWKDLKGRKPGELLSAHRNLTTAKGDLGHQVDSMTHTVGATQPLPAVTQFSAKGLRHRRTTVCTWAWSCGSRRFRFSMAMIHGSGIHR